MRNKITLLMLPALLLATPVLAKEYSPMIEKCPMVDMDGGKMEQGSQGKDRMKQMMQRRDEMMKKMDKDGDGSISKQEFVAAHEARFAEMDSNKDGKLDKADRAERRKDRNANGGWGKKPMKDGAMPDKE